MGSKKKRPALDPAMSVVREMFQRNLQVANKVQHRSKSDIITKFDLTDKFYARRIKAVCNLVPEMQKRYASKYPRINIAQEFADVASMPLISYDIIDEESYLCLGAAIWMLDRIWEEHHIQELCDLLPEDCDDVDMLEVYDTRYSYELIERMLWVIQNRYGKGRVTECIGEKYADSFYNFPIEDPYEMCFAILYLLDQDDDYAWTYSFMAAVICRAASMLPWGFDRYDEPYDGFWFEDDEWIPSVPMNPEWYETLYTGDAYDDGEEPHDVSIAQLVYQNAGAILPRDMHRFDDAFRPLKKKGLKPSQAGMVCALMDVLGEASRQRQYMPSLDDEDDPEWVDDIMQLMKSSDNEGNNSIEAENEQLKKELAKLKEQAKKANYALSRENRELKEKLEKAGQETAEMTQELADLREIVFNQQTKAAEEKQESTKVRFPYHTTRRLIAFGGHDSFLREIKFKLPDVRFMGEDISSPEIIRRADVVWIQTNCIGHKSYYNIIDLARKYGRKVRYFKYASATKCAEQVV